MPSFEFEDQFEGLVVGIDEAGRGPWAGPVVAGAVVFLSKNIDTFLLDNLNDSKKLSAKKRETLYEKIMEAKDKGDLLVGIGLSSAEEIDRIAVANFSTVPASKLFVRSGIFFRAFSVEVSPDALATPSRGSSAFTRDSSFGFTPDKSTAAIPDNA